MGRGGSGRRGRYEFEGQSSPMKSSVGKGIWNLAGAAFLAGVFAWSPALAQDYSQNYAQGMMAYKTGDWSDAINFFSSSYSQAIGCGHEIDLVGADIMHWLAMSYYKNQDYSSAETYFQKEVEILSNRIFPYSDMDESIDLPTTTDSPASLGIALECLADARYALGDYESAKRNYLQAIKILKTVEQDSEVATSLAQAQKMLIACMKKVPDPQSAQ